MSRKQNPPKVKRTINDYTEEEIREIGKRAPRLDPKVYEGLSFVIFGVPDPEFSKPSEKIEEEEAKCKERNRRKQGR